MKIQYISFDGEERQNSNEQIEYSKFNDPTSFDEYDLNIISLLNENIWTCEDSQLRSIDCINDFRSLCHQIFNTIKAKTIVVLPQNFKFRYFKKSSNDGYHRSIQLKDCISFWSGSILSANLLGDRFYLCEYLFYDNCNTIIGDKRIQSAFSFETSSCLTNSLAGYATTIEVSKRVILTGLNFKQDGFDLDTFLMQIGLLIKNEPVPKWLNEYKILNDNVLEENLRNEKERLLSVQREIADIESQIEKNLNYKKALIASGDELVKIVFDMLEEILDYDLSHFKDIKKEDFLVEKNENVFIGEIKGISTNVKSANITQLEKHYQDYLEDHPETNVDNVKALLIINPLRNLEISEREEIHENQIKLAERYSSLIITTETLIKLFEKLQRHETDPDKIVELLMSKSGQLTCEDF